MVVQNIMLIFILGADISTVNTAEKTICEVALLGGIRVLVRHYNPLH